MQPRDSARYRVSTSLESGPEIIKNPDEAVVYLPRVDAVGADVFERMIRVEGGINAAEDNGNSAA